MYSYPITAPRQTTGQPIAAQPDRTAVSQNPATRQRKKEEIKRKKIEKESKVEKEGFIKEVLGRESRAG